MSRGWQINAFGLAIIFGLVVYILDKFGDRVLSILDHIIKSVF